MKFFTSDRRHPHGDDLIIVCVTGGEEITWLTVSHVGGVLVRENLPGISTQKDAETLSRGGIQAGLDIMAGLTPRKSTFTV